MEQSYMCPVKKRTRMRAEILERQLLGHRYVSVVTDAVDGAHLSESQICSILENDCGVPHYCRMIASRPAFMCATT